MDQTKTPLYTLLCEHTSRQPISFHVPGHKYGAVFYEEALSTFVPLLHLDVTELSHLDDLHHPTGAIEEAQQLAAKLYGVKQTYFLVNGSTSGNLAMITAACEKNKKVIVQRNCHKSILHALHLVGATPIFISPEFDEDVRVMSFVSFETIYNTLREHSDAAALILTNPNYYGMSIDLTKIIQLAHSYRMPVLVDEAHGAHFVLGEPFPKSAVECGADIVVQSAHKTLPAMTMGSFLHFNSDLIDERTLRYFLQVFQTSSPSYPIMASLDLARAYVAQQTRETINETVEQIQLFKQQLRGIEAIHVVESQHPLVRTDLLKITLQTRSVHSGYELQQLLERNEIFTEMADPYNVLLVYPLAKIKQFQMITERIKRALQSIRSERQNEHVQIQLPKHCQAVSYEWIKGRQTKQVQLYDAVGRVCAQMVVPYPPGIPILLIGEIVTKQHIELIQYLKQTGAYFQTDINGDYIEVFEEA
ncbi:aminotransferase class I/II-fold pyridoxal phosphate-dependent enzyme [Anoxybacillus ayderensis]|uniref:aminotransferase class I/II-fold pyridoxal phosphate-dependent enzyme n=1 Tax=Anoxybacillus ayderensis TaxID=265546 RepID=UPI000A270429|nr:aminotransferase class I/II-fold pyridoxal phosphate-dependent enzyme [Anoxybacillus ayderensis]OSX54177.1 arginine decarboxylase [Anoxybacillus ayderensis]